MTKRNKKSNEFKLQQIYIAFEAGTFVFYNGEAIHGVDTEDLVLALQERFIPIEDINFDLFEIGVLSPFPF